MFLNSQIFLKNSINRQLFISRYKNLIMKIYFINKRHKKFILNDNNEYR